MARIVLVHGEQRQFLETVRVKTGWDWHRIAKECGICERTIRDWRREKYKMSLEAAEKLALSAKILVPDIVEILPEFWSYKKAASAGGKERLRRHGPPGTPEGRRKGGLRSQELRRIYPERYPRRVKRKKIRRPEQSALLAEFVGIILGDGHIGRHQVTVSLNHQRDADYADFVAGLIKQLYGVTVSVGRIRNNTRVLVANSTNLVEHLIDIGLRRGNKVRQQVDMPGWIFGRREYKLGCLRGLVDTDGTVYYHHHSVKKNKYCNIGICFTSYSIPLLSSVQKILAESGFTAKNDRKMHVSLYRKAEVQRYFDIVGTHNPKHLQRCWGYFNCMVV